MNLIFGFVVAAWLIINIDDQAQHIPFPTMAACEIALVEVKKGWSKPWVKRMLCVSTGAY